MLILCDIDGVCCDFVKIILEKYNKEFNDCKKHEDIVEYDMTKILKCGKHLVKYFTKDLYDNMPQIQGSLNAINEIKKMGHRVVYVTSFTKELAGVKFDWLRNNGYLTSVNDYIEAKDKSLINGDILIDDCLENVLNYPKYAILFDSPWNRNEWITSRCKGWEEVLNKIKGVLK